MIKILSRRLLVVPLLIGLGSISQVHAQGLAAPSQASTATTYTYQRITDPADPTFNQALGINYSHVIAGYDGSGADAAHPNKGFTVSPPYGSANFVSENFPGSVQTQVVGINDYGYTCGFWIDSKGNNYGFVEWGGVFTSVKNPKTGGTTHVNQLLGINKAGTAVGFYNDANGNSHAYKYHQAQGTFSAITVPGATSTQATGINNNGHIVGFAVQNGVTSAFLLEGSTLTEFQYSGAASTQAFGINDNDKIVGTWTDSAGNTHGFTLSTPTTHAQFQTVSLPNGANDTFLNGINMHGQIVGFVQSSPTSSIAYVGTPS